LEGGSMNTESFEFEILKDGSTLPEIVRKSFRIPLEDGRSAWVIINNRQYVVQDICIGGIGIVLKNDSVFCVDQVLNDCELNIFNISIKALSGRVIHFSSDNDKVWQCGIQWVDMPADDVDRISKILSTMKAQLLKDTNVLFGEE
jgi:hypothetical protein